MTGPDSETQAAIARLQQHIHAYMRTCVIYAFAELGIADALQRQPQTLAELSQAAQTDSQALRRLLRCAQAMALVNMDAAGRCYTLMPDGRLLCSDHPFSQRHFTRLMGAWHRYEPWGHLAQIVKQGSSEGFSPTFGEDSMPFLADKPNARQVYHQGMRGYSAWTDTALIEAYDFSPFRHVVELGAGDGSFLKALLARHPFLTGTLFDIDPCESDIGQPGGSRLHCRQGSFFDARQIPGDGDLYLMKNVIHNFNDAKKSAILKNVHTAMTDGAQTARDVARRRLVLIEYVLDEDGDDRNMAADWIDLHLFVLNDGGESTLAQYRQLGQQVGLTLIRAIPTPIGRYYLEFKVSQSR